MLTHKVNYFEKELAICKSKLEKSSQGETSRGNEEDTSTLFFRIEELLEDKLSKIDEKIEETISRKLIKQPTNSKEQIDVAVTNITRHLTENEKKIRQKIDSALQVKKTYAIFVQENLGGGSLLGHDPIINDFSKVIEEMRKEEIKQQKDENMQLSNIIIHLAGESYDENNNPRTNDKILLDTFLPKIETYVNVNSFFMIGKSAENKTRPIKVVFESEMDKKKVMANLRKLKCASGCLKGISVTEDFTIEEREIVQKFAKDVKDKNNNGENSPYIRRTMGSPKNGNMCLVRFPKCTN